MDRNTFESLADQFGDFYVYYIRNDSSTTTTYAVGTTEFDIPYIKAKGTPPTPSEDEVVFFSFTSDKFRILPLSRIKRLTPLQDVLKNGTTE